MTQITVVSKKSSSKLKEFFLPLTEEDQKIYSDNVGLSHSYIKTRLIRTKSQPASIPEKETLYSLADNSEGQVSRLEVLLHFYPEITEDLNILFSELLEKCDSLKSVSA